MNRAQATREAADIYLMYRQLILSGVKDYGLRVKLGQIYSKTPQRIGQIIKQKDVERGGR